jgi:hypothetical protein
MYDEVCQGRKAPSVLTSAAFAHFMGILIHNQTLDLIEELHAILDRETQPRMTFGLKLTATNPVVSVMLEWARNQEVERSLEYSKEWGSQADWDARVKEIESTPIVALSDEELAERRTALIDQILKGMPADEYAAHEKERERIGKRYRELLRSRMQSA